MACHATPRHALACAMPSHPEGHRRSMKSPSPSYLAKQRSPKRKFRTVHSFLHIPIILFFPPFLFLVLPKTVPCRRVVPDWDSLTSTLSYTSPLLVFAICSVPVPASLLFFHGRYISLPSSTFPSLPRHEPPVSTLRSTQHRHVLSFMATFPHNHSSLVFKTSSPHNDHVTTHHVFTTPVSVQRHGLFVSLSSSSSPFPHLNLLSTVPPLAAIHPPQQPPVTPTLVPPLDASRASLSYAVSSALGQKPPTPPPENVPSEEHVASWFSDSRSHSSQYTAENTCEMICYLWFSQSSSLSPVNTSPSQPIIPFNPQTARLQFSVSSVFVHFMQKLLQTTQLSQSVIVLSLHYVYRLKERNSGTIAHPGSEFRVSVAALMMANKFVDE